MNRRDFLATSGAAMLAASGGLARAGAASGKRPNILWISCEDMSPRLGCYGDAQAITPNLDRLAGQGTRYTRAFSVSGVCAPTRSCIITGMYPTSIGTFDMRCRRTPDLPVLCFPEYLRNAGYYCTNNRKEDYNFATPASAWDESSGKAHWRNRPDKDQPFFSVFNITLTHESRIGTPPDKMRRQLARHLEEGEWHRPEEMELPPYFPDTPVVRRQWAHYYDLITAMDGMAGEILRELEEDGLADDTIVFFWADHGDGTPCAKRWNYDSGIQVPVVVRGLPGREPGTVCPTPVSFVDLAPTVLALAGVEVPEYMQGRPFPGVADAPPRQYVYAARDRMDERYECIRAVRDKQFKYLRNYEPWRPYDQYLEYPEQYPIMREMRRMEAAGELNEAQRKFLRDRKPLEELYDTDADPYELDNLADQPEHAATLARLRKACDDWMRRVRDLGAVPEPELDAWLAADGKEAPAAPPRVYKPVDGSQGAQMVYGRPVNAWGEALNTEAPLFRLWAARALAAAVVVDALVPALEDWDSGVAYWAAMGLGFAEDPLPEQAFPALEKALAHEAVHVRVAAAFALGGAGGQAQALPVLLAGCAHANEWTQLAAVQALEELGVDTPEVRAALENATNSKSNDVAKVARHALKLLG